MHFYCIKKIVPTITLAVFCTVLGASVTANELRSEPELVIEPGSATVMFDFSGYTQWLHQLIDEKGVPGSAMAIVSREGILDLHTWGVSSVGGSEPITSDSVFRIASMSKTFAGTAATLLIDRELQQWDVLLTDLFPQIQLGTGVSSREITFKHIVSHSSGLMPHSYSNMLDAGVGYEKIKEKFHEIPTVCAPGQCYGYQNVVFSLIADVVEQSTGSSFEDFLSYEIFQPLGMEGASMGLEAFANDPKATVPHRPVRNGWRTTTVNPAYYTVAPASGINANVEDMTLWLRANLGAYPEVLSEKVLQEVHEPVISSPYGNYFNRWRGLDDAYYAIGWRVFDYKGLRAIHHGGGVRGFRSEMVIVPEANVGMVLLLNGESNLANDVVPGFLDTVSETFSKALSQTSQNK